VWGAFGAFSSLILINLFWSSLPTANLVFFYLFSLFIPPALPMLYHGLDL